MLKILNKCYTKSISIHSSEKNAAILNILITYDLDLPYHITLAFSIGRRKYPFGRSICRRQSIPVFTTSIGALA